MKLQCQIAMASEPTVQHRFRLRLGGMMFLLVTLFIGLAALHSQVNLLFLAFGLMLGAAGLSFLLSRAMVSGLTLDRRVPHHAEAGQPIRLSYTLGRQWRWPASFGLLIQECPEEELDRMDRNPVAWLMHLPAGGKRTVDIEVTCVRRGMLKLDDVAVVSRFPFGLIEARATWSLPAAWPIYPQRVPIPDRRLASLHRDRPASPGLLGHRAGGHEDFFGLREYREGDSIRLVDWKTTARLGELISRELSRPGPNDLMVLLDLRGGAMRHEASDEHAIKLTATLIDAGMRRGQAVGLTVVGVSGPTILPQRGQRHRDRLMRALAEIDTGYAIESETWADLRRQGRWVVVHAGLADSSFGPAGAAHLGAGEDASWKSGGPEQRVREVHAS